MNEDRLNKKVFKWGIDHGENSAETGILYLKLTYLHWA